MQVSDLHGVIPPLVTPMLADGSLNLNGVLPVVDFVLQRGVHGILATGSQGESFSLSMDERQQVLDAILVAVNGRVPVIAGTGAITTRDAVKLSRLAEEAGADAIAPITPYFITPSQDEIYAYYDAIADAVSIPVLAYSNPMRTHVTIQPETLARLAEDIPHFVGVKDSGGDLSATANILRLCPPDFKVFVGRDTLIYPALSMGVAGAVALAINVIPAQVVSLYEAFRAGDHERARALQTVIAAFRESLTGIGTYPAPIKEALNILGLPAGPPRLPVQPLSEAACVRLSAIMRAAGIDVPAR